MQRKPLVDWRSVILAAFVSGLVFFALTVLWLPLVTGANAWIVVRQQGSVLLGSDVLAPPATFHAGALAATLATHAVISIAATALIAMVVHRGGLLTGILGGALLGLSIYAINVYSFTYFAPRLWVFAGWPFAVIHTVFGAVAGGIYELFEVERFEFEPDADFAGELDDDEGVPGVTQ